MKKITIYVDDNGEPQGAVVRDDDLIPAPLSDWEIEYLNIHEVEVA